MKIAIVSGHLSGHGGTEKVVTELIKYDPKNKYTLFLGDKNGDLGWLDSIKNAKVKFATKNKKIFKLIFSVLFFLSTDSDVVLALSTQYIRLAWICNKFRLKKYRLVSWIHFSLFDEPTVNLSDLKKASGHLAISSGIKRQMIKIGIDEKAIKTVYNPVFMQKSNPINHPSECLRLCYVGRIQFEGQKNLQELFQALAEFDSGWSLRLVGDGNLEEVQKCKEFLLQEKMSHNVEWVGWVKDPWVHTSDIDYTVLTSKYEGLPLVLIEAISRGIPCISADCPTGTDDVIQPENGFLYKSGSVKDLVKHLYLAQSAKAQNLFNTTTVKGSLNKFSIDNYVELMNEGYQMSE